MDEKVIDQRYIETRRVTVVGAFIDLVLGVIKIIVGKFGNSQALIADGVHSLSDLVTDGAVIWVAWHGTQEADAEHPYGHERIQTITTVLLGIALIVVAMGIAYEALLRLISSESLGVPGIMTLVIAAVSIVAKEWIYHYTMRVARRIRSKLLKANAWHSRSDALSSVVVLLGIAGSMAGVAYLDAVAAIIVAAMIVHVGWRLGWDSVHELIDTGLDKTHLENMSKAMLSIEGVRDIHQLRTRRMGHQVVADVHVIVEPKISVSEGHRISEEVERALIDELEDPADITVHVDPEEDEKAVPAYLPLRNELVPALKRNWSAICDIPLQRVSIHYLGDKISMELFVAVDDVDDMEAIKQYTEQLQHEYAANNQVSSLNVNLTVG